MFSWFTNPFCAKRKWSLPLFWLHLWLLALQKVPERIESPRCLQGLLFQLPTSYRRTFAIAFSYQSRQFALGNNMLVQFSSQTFLRMSSLPPLCARVPFWHLIMLYFYSSGVSFNRLPWGSEDRGLFCLHSYKGNQVEGLQLWDKWTRN